MKKISILAFVLVAALVSCNKENNLSDNNVAVNTGKDMITLEVSMQKPTPVGRASLDGLDIKWSSSDKIAIVSDLGTDDIQQVSLTVDPLDETAATISFEAVAGATTYYAYYPYSGSLTFDAATATFSGCNVANTKYGKDGYNPVQMAGKSAAGRIIFKPCLTMFAIRIAESSVDAHIYKGVAAKQVYGFDFYPKKDGSGKRVTGNYSVDLSGDDLVLTASSSEYRLQLATYNTALKSDAVYYFGIIPPGNMNELLITTFTVGDGWTAYNNVKVSKSLDLSAGKFIDLGTIDPVGLAEKKAEKEEQNAAAGTILAAIDWSTKTERYDSLTMTQSIASGGSAKHPCQSLKFDYDENYIYGYFNIDQSCAANLYDLQGFQYINVWVDSDGVTTGQSTTRQTGGAYTGYDYAFRARCASYYSGPNVTFQNKSTNKGLSLNLGSFNTYDAHVTGTDVFGSVTSTTTGILTGTLTAPVLEYKFAVRRADCGMTSAGTYHINVSLDMDTNYDHRSYRFVPNTAGFDLTIE